MEVPGAILADSAGISARNSRECTRLQMLNHILNGCSVCFSRAIAALPASATETVPQSQTHTSCFKANTARCAISIHTGMHRDCRWGWERLLRPLLSHHSHNRLTLHVEKAEGRIRVCSWIPFCSTFWNTIYLLFFLCWKQYRHCVKPTLKTDKNSCNLLIFSKPQM